LLIVSLSKQ